MKNSIIKYSFAFAAILLLVGCGKQHEEYSIFQKNLEMVTSMTKSGPLTYDGLAGDDLLHMRINSNRTNYLIGGKDNDTFKFSNSRFSKHVIKDFKIGEDKIDLSDFYESWGKLQANIFQEDGDVVIMPDRNNAIIIQGYQVNQLGKEQFVFGNSSVLTDEEIAVEEKLKKHRGCVFTKNKKDKCF